MQLNCLVFDEVADVSVHLSEDKCDIITKAHLSASNGFNGSRTTLVVICEEISSIFIELYFGKTNKELHTTKINILGIQRSRYFLGKMDVQLLTEENTSTPVQNILTL